MFVGQKQCHQAAANKREPPDDFTVRRQVRLRFWTRTSPLLLSLNSAQNAVLDQKRFPFMVHIYEKNIYEKQNTLYKWV